MFFRKTLDIITLFHKAGSPASVRAATALKQFAANASEAATEDQASDHSQQTKATRDFELNITEDPPTADQLKTIFQYAGAGRISSIVKGATTENVALKKVAENPDNFIRPVIVDWANGKAISSDNESEILKLVEQLNSK